MLSELESFPTPTLTVRPPRSSSPAELTLSLLRADDIALAAAASFTTVALLSLLYTGYTYVWRVTKIRCAGSSSGYFRRVPRADTLRAGIARPSTTTIGSALRCCAACCSSQSSSTSVCVSRTGSELICGGRGWGSEGRSVLIWVELMCYFVSVWRLLWLPGGSLTGGERRGPAATPAPRYEIVRRSRLLVYNRAPSVLNSPSFAHLPRSNQRELGGGACSPAPSEG